ncbi:MAG: MucR family transcriptional regulator [Kiloniellaceae bacterium]
MANQGSVVNLLEVTSRIVAAHVSNNPVHPTELPQLINGVHEALSRLGREPTAEPAPAVPVEDSVKGDYIVCLEDGKRLKTLKRHLRAAYGMSPEEYRAKWKLPPNYPMVAASYSEQRRKLAKRIGLGRKPGAGTDGGRRSAP